MIRLIIWFSICTGLLSSCKKSEGIPSEKLYSSYELFYDEDENITYASAWFIYNNSTIKLNSKNKVTFNNTALSYKEQGAYYQVQFSGLILSGRFKWSDGKRTLNNDIDLRPLSFRNTIDSLSLSTTDTLYFSGNPLAENEYLKLTVDGIHPDDEVVFYETNPGLTGMIMTGLDNATNGKNRFILERIYNPAISQHSGAGGNLQSRYRTKVMTITLY